LIHLANRQIIRIPEGGLWGNLTEAMIMAVTEPIILKIQIKTSQDLGLIALDPAKENPIYS